MSRSPVILKLVSEEVLFCEVESMDKGMLAIYHPHKVSIKGVNLELAQWVPFSDDEVYHIQADKIVSISSMDDFHRKMYGTIVLGLSANNIKRAAVDAIKININLAQKLNNIFDELLYSTTEIGLKYKISVPDIDLIREQFYSFVFNNMERTKYEQ